MRKQRGFTLAEMLTVLVIAGLAMSVIAFSIPLILRGPGEAQLQVDDVNSAALALYKMQHDARPSNIQGIFACSISPVMVCNAPAPGPSLPPAQAVVILSADRSGQFRIDGSGNPAWQGFVVYWLTLNADGTSNELRRAFYSMPGVTLPLDASVPVTALSSVIFAPDYITVAQDVRSMAAAIDTTSNTVDLQIDGGQNSSNKSSIRLAGNSYVRN